MNDTEPWHTIVNDIYQSLRLLHFLNQVLDCGCYLLNGQGRSTKKWIVVMQWSVLWAAPRRPTINRLGLYRKTVRKSDGWGPIKCMDTQLVLVLFVIAGDSCWLDMLSVPGTGSDGWWLLLIKSQQDGTAIVVQGVHPRIIFPSGQLRPFWHARGKMFYILGRLLVASMVWVKYKNHDWGQNPRTHGQVNASKWTASCCMILVEIFTYPFLW